MFQVSETTDRQLAEVTPGPALWPWKIMIMLNFLIQKYRAVSSVYCRNCRNLRHSIKQAKSRFQNINARYPPYLTKRKKSSVATADDVELQINLQALWMQRKRKI
jgi:hypothetical protein